MLASVILAAQLTAGVAHVAQPAAMQPAGSVRLLQVDIDDVGFDLLRATPTPTLDWLEANGRFFTSFTTAPLCSPTRAMVNLGVYPTHPDLLLGKNVGGIDVYSMPLSPLEPLAAVIASSGRTTAKVGKWHLAPVSDPTHVLSAGWQRYRGSLSNLRTGGTADTYFDYTKWIDGQVTDNRGRYATTDESNDAIRYIRQGIDFVSLSYHAPHVPVHLPPDHLHSVTPLASEYDQTRAMLAACDTELGRVVREAIGAGYSILVFSDNGTSQTIGGQKGTLFEGGIVTPFWAFGDGIQPGRDDSRIGALDVYDTVLEFFGISADSPTRGPQSRSFARALIGLPQYRRWSYSDRYGVLGEDPRMTTDLWPRALRTDRFKLMRDQGAFGDQLFDLLSDPRETANLLRGPLGPEAQVAYDQLRIVLDPL